MNRGVTYLMTGTKHLAVCAVSIHSLRKFWDGPVTLFIEPGNDIACMIAAAGGCNVVEFEPSNYRRNSGYVNKTRLPSMSPYEYTLQLDADTLIVGKLDEIWPTQRDEWVLTQYSNWDTAGNIIRGRVEKWRQVAPRETEIQLANTWPALNTGIMAYGCDCEVALIDWMAYTLRLQGEFMIDELAAQVMLSVPAFLDHITVLDSRWNYSPWYGVPELFDDRRIEHHHGAKHVTRGADSWVPEFTELWEKNYAGICEWAPAGDKRLSVWMEHHDADLINEFA